MKIGCWEKKSNKWLVKLMDLAMVEMVRKYLTVTSINNCNKVSQRVDIFPEQVFSDCLLSYTYDLSGTTLMQSHRKSYWIIADMCRGGWVYASLSAKCHHAFTWFCCKNLKENTNKIKTYIFWWTASFLLRLGKKNVWINFYCRMFLMVVPPQLRLKQNFLKF